MHCIHRGLCRLSRGGPPAPTDPIPIRRPCRVADRDTPKHFTAKFAKIATAHRISENPGDSTVQNFPDPLSDFQSRVLEIPGVSLRALRPLRFKCNVWVQAMHRDGFDRGIQTDRPSRVGSLDVVGLDLTHEALLNGASIGRAEKQRLPLNAGRCRMLFGSTGLGGQCIHCTQSCTGGEAMVKTIPVSVARQHFQNSSAVCAG